MIKLRFISFFNVISNSTLLSICSALYSNFKNRLVYSAVGIFIPTRRNALTRLIDTSCLVATPPGG